MEITGWSAITKLFLRSVGALFAIILLCVSIAVLALGFPAGAFGLVVSLLALAHSGVYIASHFDSRLQRFWGLPDIVTSAVLAVLFFVLAVVCATYWLVSGATLGFLAFFAWLGMVIVAVIDMRRGVTPGRPATMPTPGAGSEMRPPTGAATAPAVV